MTKHFFAAMVVLGLNGPTGPMFAAMDSSPTSQFDDFKPVAEAVLATLQFK
ncbi:MAG: hypothetical protein ABI559_00035 [Chloroflexota bacterium]